MIPQETIEQVAAASDIVEVVGAYVPLKRAGAMYKALCPFHKEKSPSFTVNPGRQIFKCFGCGAGGGVFKFVTMFVNIDFPSAVRMLAEKAGIAIVEERGDFEQERGAGQTRRRLLALHAEAADWFHRNLMKSPEAGHARDYLKARGLTAEVAARWKIGFAPNSYDACLHWATERGYRREELIQGGLFRPPDEGSRGNGYDRFRDRLMFSICNEVGEVIGFSGRVLGAEAKGAKYVNSPESPIFTKGKVLFGLHLSKRALLDQKFAIICEGQIDLITAFEAGVTNVIAPQGTAFTEQQARLLKRHADEVVLCFDSDNAGQQAAEKSLPALLESNVSVRVATMPPGEDPDSLIRGQGVEAFQARIKAAQDFFDFQMDRLAKTFDMDTPRGKAQFSRKIAEAVALLTDNVLREAVVGKVTARAGITPESFRSLLRRRPGPRAREGAVDLRAGGAEVSPSEPTAPAFEPPPREVGWLMKVALESDEARAWLAGQPWEEVLHLIQGGELLGQVLMADYNQENPQGLSLFLSTLSPLVEEYVTGLIMQKPYPQPLPVAKGWWKGLEQKILLERQTALELQQNLPGQAPGEIARLQKEVLDLHQRLKDIARL